LARLAFKMATGSGKTVVVAMLMAWQALNKQANPQDRRFNDKFLIVTPGITIRDRLRVLLPNDPQNYYQQMDLVSADNAPLGISDSAHRERLKTLYESLASALAVT
jgi:type III restriction enzyme